MEKLNLEAIIRKETGKKTNKGRKEGMIPSVVYGAGIKAENLWVNALDLRRLLKKSGESVIINLNIGGSSKNVIIHEIQRDPVAGKYIHLDFFQVRMDEKIEADIHIEYIGESPAVKELGGVLVKSIEKVTVECFPADLPSHINVDISAIKLFDDHIAVKDIKISDKVEIKLDMETVVASVAPPRSEEELSGLEEKVEADVTKVEGVIKPEKTESEAEENKNKKEKK